MKRHGQLWDQVVSFEALPWAAEQARKGKRFRPAVAAFHFDQERTLWKLHEELSTKTYRPGGYRVFPTHRLLPKENVWRFRRRVRGMQEDYAAGRACFADIYQRLMSWSGHARQANTYRLRCRLFDTISFQRATTK